MIRKKRISKKSFLKEQYSQSWNYIKRCRGFIFSAVILFFAFVLIGFFVPVPDILIEKILEYFKKIVEMTQGMSAAELIAFIFTNNLQASFFGMIFGVVLGIYPVLAAIANGYIVGFVVAMGVNENGLIVLLDLIPHGIFELPALFISLGMGLKIGSFIFQKKKSEAFKEYFWNSLRVFIFVVIPLLILAAIIEGSLIFAFR